MDEKLYFSSVGLIQGTYLPSSEDRNLGTIITQQGIFPASLEYDASRFFDRDLARKKSKKASGKPAMKKENRFVCWLDGIDNPPFYKFKLVAWQSKKTHKSNLSKLLREPNNFITRGIVIDRDRGFCMVKVQKNPKPERTASEIASYKNILKIVNCPSKVRTSQFWQFKSSFENGFLHCQAVDLLAYAKEAKKLLLM